MIIIRNVEIRNIREIHAIHSLLEYLWNFDNRLSSFASNEQLIEKFVNVFVILTINTQTYTSPRNNDEIINYI